MCDGPKCAFCGIPITEEQRNNIVVRTKNGKSITPALVKKDFSVIRYDDGSPRLAVHNLATGDKIVHAGKCNHEFVMTKRVLTGSAA